VVLPGRQKEEGVNSPERGSLFTEGREADRTRKGQCRRVLRAVEPGDAKATTSLQSSNQGGGLFRAEGGDSLGGGRSREALLEEKVLPGGSCKRFDLVPRRPR
jgi:hypothetical protein